MKRTALLALTVSLASLAASADPIPPLSVGEATNIRLGKDSREPWRPYAITLKPAKWSHCPLAPIFVLYQDIVGLRPLSPGFARLQLRPQLGDLPDLDVVAHTPCGPVKFHAKREVGGHRVEVELPKACEAELLLPEGITSPFPALAPAPGPGVRRYRLPPGGGVFQVPLMKP